MGNPYKHQPRTSFWKTGVAEVSPLYPYDLWVKKWDIAYDDVIATAGSCFAQHISNGLSQNGFNIVDFEPPPDILDSEASRLFGYNLYSARYGNIYTVRQLLQLAQEATGEINPTDFVWKKGKRYIDAFRPSVEPDGLDQPEEVLYHRDFHLRQVQKLLAKTDVFIFTLGLTEAWSNTSQNIVFPMAPGTIAGHEVSNKCTLVNFAYDSIVRDFLEFRKLVHVCQRNEKRCKFLLTVSPVPLTATATSNHVLLANTYSKSVLRAVAGFLSENYDDIDYFPSFEIINSHWTRGIYYDANLRTVAREGVDVVMKLFFSQHKPKSISQLTTSSDIKEVINPDIASKSMDPACEESLLEIFGH